MHFADGVLEEALNSELEINQRKRPLLICEQQNVSDEFTERVVSGIPFWCDPVVHQIPVTLSRVKALAELQQLAHVTGADALIAYGSSSVFPLADACCRKAKNAEQAAVSPALFVVPGLDGVPAMSRPRGAGLRSNVAARGAGIEPQAVIFDPSLIAGEEVERKASAIACIIARCFSANLSTAYNPPADGIAIDGLKRIARNLPGLLNEDSPHMRRELMAASLSGTLALQKDPGIANDLCKALMSSSARPMDEGALARLLIVVEAELMELSLPATRIHEIRDDWGIPRDIGLREWLVSMLNTLPLPATLHEMGVNEAQIIDSAYEMAASWAAIVPSASSLIDRLNGIQVNFKGKNPPLVTS